MSKKTTSEVISELADGPFVTDLEDEIKALRTALQFYADITNYDGSTYMTTPEGDETALPILVDDGHIARAALGIPAAAPEK